MTQNRHPIVKRAADLVGDLGQIGIVLAEADDLEADVLSFRNELAEYPQDVRSGDLLLVEDVQARREMVDRVDRRPDRLRDRAAAREEHARQDVRLAADRTRPLGQLAHELRPQHRLAAGHEDQLGAVVRGEGRDEPDEDVARVLLARQHRVRRAVGAAQWAAPGEREEESGGRNRSELQHLGQVHAETPFGRTPRVRSCRLPCISPIPFG